MSDTAIQHRDPRQRVPEQTVVRMVNNGPETFHERYIGQDFIVPPGEQAFVPFYAMTLWAGHPDAVDLNKKERYRTDELSRLQVKYGTHSFNGCWTTDICNGNPGPDRAPKHPPRRHLPDISFFAVDTGEEYATVLRDPEGTSTASLTSQLSQDELSNRAMADMQRQIAELQRLIAAQNNEPAPAPHPTNPPTPSGVQGVAAGTTTGYQPIPINEDGERPDDPEDDWDDNHPVTNGPLDHAIPVDESELAGTGSRKPRIPPAPGPLR